MKLLRFILAFFTIAVSLHAEDGIIINTDSLPTVLLPDIEYKTNQFKVQGAPLIVPAVFISYGVLAQVWKPLQRLDERIDREVNRHFTQHRKFDDYLQFAPVAAVYGLDLAGVKAKHNFRDRTLVVVTSHLIVSGVVQTVKRTTCVERPDGSSFHSFPSGHTATAFVGAHILFREYQDVTPWIGVVGYAAATTVGVMRITNRKHWMSDVVAGAGVGILSAEIGYMMLPVFHKIIGVEQTRSALTIMPVVGNNQYGLGMAVVF